MRDYPFCTLISFSSFSRRFRIGFIIRLIGPRDVVICLKLSISYWSIVRVSKLMVKNANAKVATPMIKFIQLLKVSCD